MSGGIPKRWEELHGKDHWSGLIDPLDVDLRRHIIHYGSMVQATYDAFNSNKLSKNFGKSRYARANFFDRVGLRAPGGRGPFPYKVTKFVYSTSDVHLPGSFLLDTFSSRQSSWMGYVAVATDEGKAALGRRDIVVAWRGTKQLLEWAKNVDFFQTPVPDVLLPDADSAAGEVERGFLSVYTSCNPDDAVCRTSAREQVLSEIRRLVEQYKDEEVSITVTGHSLGAAIATLNAFDIAANGCNGSFPVAAIAFASPRVGDGNFKKAFEALPHLRLLRIRNEGDLVTSVPPRIPHRALDYVDVGEEVEIDTAESPYLNSSVSDPRSRHNLELYLHAVAGTKGKGGGFELVVDRDIALVNKSIDGLKDEYMVPPAWWVEKNSGMVLGEDGKWELRDFEELEELSEEETVSVSVSASVSVSVSEEEAPLPKLSYEIKKPLPKVHFEKEPLPAGASLARRVFEHGRDFTAVTVGRIYSYV